MSESSAEYEVTRKEKRREFNAQDMILKKFRGKRVNCFLANGIRLDGVITHYDKWTIIIDGDGDMAQLVYKSAISTISLAARRQMSRQERTA